MNSVYWCDEWIKSLKNEITRDREEEEEIVDLSTGKCPRCSKCGRSIE